MALATCQSWHMVYRSMWYLQTHHLFMGGSLESYLQNPWHTKKAHIITKRLSSSQSWQGELLTIVLMVSSVFFLENSCFKCSSHTAVSSSVDG